MYELIYNGSVYGTMGECADYDGYKVGDLFIVTSKDYKSKPLVLVKDISDDEYKILGFLGYDLKTLHEVYTVEKVGSYKLLNYDNINKLLHFNVTIRKKEIKKLTHNQIKDILGYDFEIVEEELNNEYYFSKSIQ